MTARENFAAVLGAAGGLATLAGAAGAFAVEDIAARGAALAPARLPVGAGAGAEPRAASGVGCRAEGLIPGGWAAGGAGAGRAGCACGACAAAALAAIPSAAP